jgi:hypothetical protein
VVQISDSRRARQSALVIDGHELHAMNQLLKGARTCDNFGKRGSFARFWHWSCWVAYGQLQRRTATQTVFPTPTELNIYSDTDGNGVLDVCECPAGRVWTLDAHFDEGTLFNVHHDVHDQLQLNAPPELYPYVNVACSDRGTAVKIHVGSADCTVAPKIVGEYRTAPDGRGKNPSRTTVDHLGNVWVANRDEASESPPGSGENKGSITRIGLVIGGTPVNAQGQPDDDGQFLAGPFEYCTCEDRHVATVNDRPGGGEYEPGGHGL